MKCKRKTNSGKNLSQCDFIIFNLQYRKRQESKDAKIFYEFNPLHYGGKLTQQWIVERWCCVESARLIYLRLNQDKIRAASYSGLQDFLNNAIKLIGAQLGRQVILPLSFTVGPRYMLNSYNDAMCICAKFGIPDLFITLTCDPTNPDILANILSGDTANNHPLLCSRIFK